MRASIQIGCTFLCMLVTLCIFTYEVQAQAVPNSTCFLCHSNLTLKKTITLSNGTQEFVPLYVDSTKFQSNKHGALLCVNCHTDITTANQYSHQLPKFYGGWARFSAKNDTVTVSGERTRNYTTAAAMSCNKNGCHGTQAAFDTSTHYLTYKQKHASLRTVNGESVGEAYVNNDCNRCHTTCATCHFRSTKNQYLVGDILTIWDSLQTFGDATEPLKTTSNNLTQYAMDWTTNVESHTFLTGDSLRANNDVCRSCHLGYYKPPMNGFLSLEEPYPKAYGTNIRRHPQTQEVTLSATHTSLNCANCHTDVHSVPGTHKVDWQIEGDVICQTCHTSPNHSAFGDYAQHTTVDCISCHFRGFVKTTGQIGHDVWRLENNPSGRVRPLAMKYNEAVSWYPHNIEKPNMTTSCATKCHYDGNLLGATTIVSVASTGDIPKKFALEQNYPNPFNPSTLIRFDLPVSAPVFMTVYNALGQKVAQLINGDRLQAGSHSLEFNPQGLASGIYFYKLQAGSYSAVRKLILLR